MLTKKQVTQNSARMALKFIDSKINKPTKNRNFNEYHLNQAPLQLKKRKKIRNQDT